MLRLLLGLALAVGGGCAAPDGRGGPAGPRGGDGVAPRVVLVVADDLGWDLLERSPTPNLDALAAAGTTFRRFWVTPKCGPTRAALLTGRFHFRIGGGSGEVGQRHANRSLDLEEPYLPRAVAARRGGGGRSAAFGKWHLSHEPEHPNRAGFDHFAGSLGNLNGESYRRWTRVVDGRESICRRYATTQVTDDALAADADLVYVAYHAPHTPYHRPSAALAPVSRGREGTEEVVAMVEALDTELGRLFAAHPDDWIVFLADNGTTSLIGGGKGSFTEGGICVPLIVRGPGVRAGAVSDALVNVVDVYATVCELLDVPVPEQAEDSISFAEVLRGGPGLRGWNYSCLFRDQVPNVREEALCDADHKLVVDRVPVHMPHRERDGARTLLRMPGEVEIPPQEWTAADREAHDRLEEIRRSLLVER